MSDDPIPDRSRYLDAPYALQIVTLLQAQERLRELSWWASCPLPQRHRSICARMVLRLGEMITELEVYPDRVAIERGEEDAHHETR